MLYDVERDADTYLMKLAAVAVALEYQGGGYGLEAIEMALQAAESRAFSAGCSVVTVVGLVDPSNKHSKSACSKAGLTHFGDNGKYEEWGASIELPFDMPQR
ncbi:hypothetical protein [Geodermatophilus sp. SYSU D01176]